MKLTTPCQTEELGCLHTISWGHLVSDVEHALGAEGVLYAESLSTESRRATGTVYTPRSLVDFVLREAGFHGDEDVTVLDPSCGAGAFLLAALDRIAASVASSGTPLTTRRGRQRLLSRTERRLLGVDIDPKACALARSAIRERICELTHQPLPADFFTDNILEGDFLSADLEGRLPSNIKLVVGNPPYVQTTRLTDSQKAQFRERFRTAFGRIDLYALFFERALEILTPGGTLAFVTPDKYLSSKSMEPLRRVLLNDSAVRRIATFKSHKVFPNAATVPCVTVLERSRPLHTVHISDCAYSAARVRVLRQADVPASKRLHINRWVTLHPDILRVATRIRRGHRKLVEHTLRISAGYATGRDNIFILPTTAAAGIEPELLHPAVRGRDIQPWSISDSDRYILLPYSFESAKPALVDLSDFPGAAAYLSQFRGELVQRHCVRKWSKRWYDIHDPVSLDVPGSVKIIVPDVANRNRFAVDDGGRCPLHSCYYILLHEPEHAEHIASLLNSKPIEFLVHLAAPVVKDGFRRYRQQFLAQLPIPTLNAAARRRLAAGSASADLDAVDDIAAELFGLSAADLRLIDAYLHEQASPHAP